MATKKTKKTFEFLKEGETEIQTIEAQSFKKACRSAHPGREKTEYHVRYTNKAGNLIEETIVLPNGRMKKR